MYSDDPLAALIAAGRQPLFPPISNPRSRADMLADALEAYRAPGANDAGSSAPSPPPWSDPALPPVVPGTRRWPQADYGAAQPSTTLEDYYDGLVQNGLSPTNTNIDPRTLPYVKFLQNSGAFKQLAQPIYDASKAAKSETGGLQVYGHLLDTGVDVVPYANQNPGAPCPPGAAACETVPNIDPSRGDPLLEWHPHPFNGLPVASIQDLKRSASAPGPNGSTYPVPGAIWMVPSVGKKPEVIYYQGHPIQK